MKIEDPGDPAAVAGAQDDPAPAQSAIEIATLERQRVRGPSSIVLISPIIYIGGLNLTNATSDRGEACANLYSDASGSLMESVLFVGVQLWFRRSRSASI
ncbi:hypothetical protein [Candidatus Nephthysia bennettiae]|uniref:Uncharacterized protein n=1 Tax=Candidatus Nephthysia bennettiae TaxID=3127016 RepID=A0A934K6G9_9BACT|nr:hypothetical protein [Candidatus Dormibacteraeota bacterium]MBJ7611385.1 hypothetical protein [Candidatus Dormibacteraeota bacterium]